MEVIRKSGQAAMATITENVKGMSETMAVKGDQARVAFKDDRKGWLVCLAVLVVTIVRSGITYSFGMFVVPLEKEFGGSMLKQNWIGTLSFCISLSCAPISVSFIRTLGHKGFKMGGLLGTVILSLSCMCSSFVNSLDWLFFTHSLMYGVGSSLIYMSSSLVIGDYFHKEHRYHVLATSILLCGYPVGSLLFNPLNAWIIVTFKWRVAFRISSALILVIGTTCCWFFSAKETVNAERLGEVDEAPSPDEPGDGGIEEEEKKQPRKCCTWSEVKGRPEIVLWYLGNCLSYLGFYMPFVNLAYYMQTKKIPEEQSSLALTLLSMAECVTYIMASFMGDYLKDRLVYVNVYSSGALAVICIVWPFIDVAYSVILAISLAMGGFLGLNIVYTYAASGEVTQLPIDIAWSFTNLWSGIGILVGPLFSGAVFDIRHQYKDVFFTVGAVYVVDTLIFLAIPIIQRRRERIDGTGTPLSLHEIKSPMRYETYHISTKRVGSFSDPTAPPTTAPPMSTEPPSYYGAVVDGKRTGSVNGAVPPISSGGLVTDRSNGYQFGGGYE